MSFMYYVVRMHELHDRYVGKIFVRTPFKTRNEKLFETFHRINRREAEDIIQEFAKGRKLSITVRLALSRQLHEI